MEEHISTNNEWNGSAQQRIWGLMQIASEVKFNFAFFDQRPGFDWDAEVQKRIPMVLAAKEIVDYYNILQELVACLNDGHTVVMFPQALRESLDTPPLELQKVEGKILIVRCGESEEIRAQHIHPGLEIEAVDDRATEEYFHEHVLRYYRGGTEHWGYAFGLINLLRGPRNSKVHLRLTESSGKSKQVELTRNSQTEMGGTFKPRILGYDPLLETRMLDRIAYFRLATFNDSGIVELFNTELDRMNVDDLKGLILDIRFNIGGDSDIGFKLLSRLTDRPLDASRWRTRKYLPAFRAWGEEEQWYESAMQTIQPCNAKCFSGPLMILTGHHTFSSAEDFLVPIIHAKRGLLVGERTAGSTGQPLRFSLPGGGYCLICTLQSTFPDGKNFIGQGIEPDITVPLTRKDIFEGRDPVLEKALEKLSR